MWDSKKISNLDGFVERNEILMDSHFFYIVEVKGIINQLKELR